MPSAIGTILDEIHQRLPLTDYLVGKGHALRRTGRNRMVGLCPFHGDKHRPNMVIYADEQRFHCFACLEENEPVWTSGGLKAIREVQVGNYVLDHQGSLRRVVAKRVQRKELIAVEVAAFRHDSLMLTPDHICLFVRLAHATGALPHVYVTRRGDTSALRSHGRIRSRPRRSPVGFTEDRADRVQAGDFLLFPVIPDEQRVALELAGPQPLRGRGKSKRLEPIHSLALSEDTAWLYGIWLAEGHINGDRAVWFTFGRHERDTLAQRLVKILNGLDCKASLHETDSTCAVICCRVDLARHLRHWFGSGAGLKRIPFETLRWPRHLQRALLQGYFDGDGSTRGESINAKTVSPILAYGLFALSIQTGIVPSLALYGARTGRDGVRHRQHWQLAAKRREGLDGFYERIGDTLYYWTRVIRCEPIPGQHEVVDITVEGSHTFVTKLGAVHNCGAHGDIVDMVQQVEGLFDFSAALRMLADRFRLFWPNERSTSGEDSGGVLTLAAKLYAEHLSSEALAYLRSRGFPEAFVRQWRIGYAPPKSPQFLRNLLKQHKVTPEAALASGVVVEVNSRNGAYVRDFFGHAGGGYIIFPNPGRRGAVVDLQGRAFPDGGGKPKYLNLPRSRRHLFNESVLPQAAVVVPEGIPDPLSCLLVEQPAVAVYGTGGFSDRFVNQFARCRRVYIAFDLDVHRRSIEVAMQFGLRSRVLVLPEALGRKGDLNDLLVQRGAQQFRADLTQLLQTADTGYAMAINSLPADLQSYDLFETAGPLLAALGALDPVSRDAHLQLLHVKYGIAMETLRDAAREALLVTPSTKLAEAVADSSAE